MSSSAPISETRFNDTLQRAQHHLGIVLEATQLDRLYQYYSLFIKWNSAYNLSAIREPDEILVKHLLDSLAVEPLFKGYACERVIDVGTGGGLPGIVLAICHPERSFTLLDSAGKKMRFLFQVCQSLQLENVTLENCRVEAHQPHTAYDLVISRAFASLDKFVSITSHLLTENGQFWAMKGVYPEQELSELAKHYIVSGHHSLSVPELDGERCLIRLQKATNTNTNTNIVTPNYP